jgi:hypothetical protein
MLDIPDFNFVINWGCSLDWADWPALAFLVSTHNIHQDKGSICSVHNEKDLDHVYECGTGQDQMKDPMMYQAAFLLEISSNHYPPALIS